MATGDPLIINKDAELAIDATAHNPSYIIIEPSSGGGYANGSFSPSYSGFYSHTAFILNKLTNCVKTSLWIENVNSVVTYNVDPDVPPYTKQISSGIIIFHYSDVDNGGDSSGIVSSEWGYGNAATFQKYDPVYSSEVPSALRTITGTTLSNTPIARNHGVAIECDVHGAQTGLLATNWNATHGGGIAIAAGVGTDADSEGIRVFPFDSLTHTTRKAFTIEDRNNLTDTSGHSAFAIDMVGNITSRGYYSGANNVQISTAGQFRVGHAATPGVYIEDTNSSSGSRCVLNYLVGSRLYWFRCANNFGTGTNEMMDIAIAADGSCDLTVKGQIVSSCGIVTCTDFVFEDDYDLMSINEMSNYIAANTQLPGMTVNRNQDKMSLGKAAQELIIKSEEQALYIIQLHERLKELEDRLEDANILN